MATTVTYRRIYDDPAPGDARRVLVDRVWPRGIRRDADRFDEWLPAVAPSADLRKWFGHDPSRFDEFRRRYLDELADPEHAEAITHLRDIARHEGATLLTATRDAEHSHAAVLATWLAS